MKELQEILKKIESLGSDEKAVLATVVDVQGSSYRLPGAKMLILENGESYGTVSGGCLEADVMERAKQVLESGEAQIFTYDTTTNDDSVFSFNMGCRGVIRILLERIGNSSPLSQMFRIAFGDRLSSEMQTMATLIGGDTDKIGGRLSYYRIEEFDLEDLPERFRNISELNKDLLSFYSNKELPSHSKKYWYEENTYEFFFDRISPPINICVFGAGADAVPLAKLSKELGWHTTVVDHRTALANNERFENPDEIVISRPEDVREKVSLTSDSVAVVMTHNYDHDKTILESLFEAELKYIGLLGPKMRTENILRELREKGVEISDQNLESLHAPVGLDTGAHLPETIALSILAEIQTVLAERKGGFLKNRDGSIYGRK